MKKLKWNRFCTILVLMMFITVTYASFNTNLFIDGKAYVRVDRDIRITNITLLNVEENGYENTNSEYTNRTISTDVSLPKQASSVTYEVTISNVSDRRYKITDIIEDSYDNRDVKYELIDASIGNIVEPHTEKTFRVKFTNNTTVVEEEDVYETKTYNFDYTGDIQEFVAPYDGTYTLEVWGASGGGANNETIGYGGYSTGKINLKANEKLYVYVGGAGSTSTENTTGNYIKIPGGWNGGGLGYADIGYSSYKVGSGGGSTDIRKIKANINYKNNAYYTNHEQSLQSRIIVAGGGGGQGHNDKNPSAGGHAGGVVGNAVTSSWNDSHTHPSGGTQTTGTFGYGSSPVMTSTSTHLDSGQNSQYCSGGAGSGWYGGQASIYQNCRNFGGAGGSGYIGTEALFDKAMYCYNCQESNETSTKTISVDSVSTNPEAQKAKIGNGYAKISFTRKVEDDSEYDFDFTGGEQTFVAPYTGLYKLETWGAQGGSSKNNYNGGYGGYSTGKIKLNKNTSLYIYVGGKGFACETLEAVCGGYNGGGDAGYKYTSVLLNGGGGATDISLTTGLLSTKYNSQSDVLIVSGGGGGSYFFSGKYNGLGGSGGGATGNNGQITYENNHNVGGAGGTQEDTEDYFGKALQNAGNTEHGGGGGGWYGGKKSYACGGGGSGYIGNSLLTDKYMYCYDCTESTDKATKTLTTLSHSMLPKQNQAKEGNGYSKITLLKRTINQTKLTLDFTFEEYVNGNEYTFGYTGSEQSFNVPKTGMYQLEVWGSEGAISGWGGTGGKGGYSTGKIRLNKGEQLFINVGGNTSTYNAGGDINNSTYGGGATHIAQISGELYELENDVDSILIVAGGGGGAERLVGGSGGGFKGTDGSSSSDYPNYGSGGTQIAGGTGGENASVNGTENPAAGNINGSFGLGGSGRSTKDSGASGGGGFYGGGATTLAGAGGGGSGYIGNSLLTDKVMYCYKCEESNNVNEKTISTTNYSDTPTSQFAKTSTGFAKITMIEEIPEYAFDYTGDVQEFVAPYKGIYKVELWGASGGYYSPGNVGKGAYTSGNIELNKNQKMYLYVGESGSYVHEENGTVQSSNTKYNGGGGARAQATYEIRYWGTGGGATDIRINNGNWNNESSLLSRLMIAAGGGGQFEAGEQQNVGGAGGGLVGYNGQWKSTNPYWGTYGYGATQFAGGYSKCLETDGCKYTVGVNMAVGKLGQGGSAFVNDDGSLNGRPSAGGGSGYFGGGGSGHVQSAAGGSSYISGHPGCVSLTKNSTLNNISFVNDSNGVACNDSTSVGYNSDGYNMDDACNKHSSGKYFTNTVMIDGMGYKWDENGKSNNAVGMPSIDGRTTMVGNVGNGFARITLVEKIDTYKIAYELNDGTISGERKTYSVYDDDITLKKPTKSGYTFTGWTGGKNLLDITKVASQYQINPIEDGFKLIANPDIQDKKRRIQFNFNKPLPPGDYTISANIVESNLTTLENLYFSFRNSNGDALAVPSFVDETFHIDGEAVNVYIYIKGSEPEGNTISIANLQIENGTEATSYEAYLTTPTKDITISSRSVGNRRYIANWAKNYTTNFDGNGGTSYSVTVSAADTSTYYPISQQAGKVFTGWYTERNSGTYVNQASIDYHKDRTLYAHWGDEKTITEGQAITPHITSYADITYDSTSKEYTVLQKEVPSSGVNWTAGMVGFNNFGPIPYGYRFSVSFEIYPPADFLIQVDGNASCTNCATVNDNYADIRTNVNDTTERNMYGNRWNSVNISYSNNSLELNPEMNPLTDFTAFKLNTLTQQTYKVRNIKYTFVPIE